MEPEPEPVEEPQPEVTAQEPAPVQPTPEPEQVQVEPAQTQPMPRPVAAAAAAQSSLEGLLDAFSQNLRGDEIQAILAANPHTFHISGTVKGDKATLLGEIGWRDGRTLTVSTPLGDVDVQLPSAMPTDLRHVDHHVLLHDWNRGLARPVFRLA